MGNEFELSTCTTEDLVEEVMRRYRSCIVVAVQDRTADQDALILRVCGSPIEVFGLAEFVQEKTRIKMFQAGAEE